MKKSLGLGVVGWVASLAMSAAPAQAGIFRNVLLGLSDSGFQFIGVENFLSGGADLTIFRNFNGETLDFGATELTLNGQPTFTFSTGGRGLQVLDFSLNTGNNPLNYTLVNDSGNQRQTITGSFLMDITGNLNSFGFYDLTFDVSSRQTVSNDGRFSDEDFENDFDIGPVNIQGNLFADLAGALLDPVFQALGIDNIFQSFSGAGAFESQLNAKIQQALSNDFDGDIDFDGDFRGIEPSPNPEPASLLILLLSSPALLRRRRRVR